MVDDIATVIKSRAAREDLTELVEWVKKQAE